MDYLTDPSLDQPRRSPRTAQELCAESHATHMTMIQQDRWYADLIARDEERKAAFLRQLEDDVAKFRETGKWPRKSPKKGQKAQKAPAPRKGEK